MTGDDTKSKAAAEVVPGQDGPAQKSPAKDAPAPPEPKELAEVQTEMRARSGIIERPDGTQVSLNQWARKYFKKDSEKDEPKQCFFTPGYHAVLRDLVKGDARLKQAPSIITTDSISALAQDGAEPKRSPVKVEAPAAESTEEAASTLKPARTLDYKTLEQLKEPSGFVNQMNKIRFGQAMDWGRLARAHDYSFARAELMGPNKSQWWEKNQDKVEDYNRFQRLTANGIYGHVDAMKANELRIWRQYSSPLERTARVEYQRKISQGDFRDFDRLGVVPPGSSEQATKEIKQDFGVAYNRLTIDQKGDYNDFLAAKIAITEARKGNFAELAKLSPSNRTVDLWLKGASDKERQGYANAVIDAQLKADTYEAANWFSSASTEKSRLVFQTLKDSRQEGEKESWWRKISNKDADAKEPFSRAQKLYMQFEKDSQDGKIEPFKRGERFDFEETKKMSDEERLKLGDYAPTQNSFKSLTDEQKTELLKNATSDERSAIKDLKPEDQLMALYLNKINAPGTNISDRFEKFKQFVINDAAGYIPHVDKMTGNQMRRWLAAASDEQRQKYLDYQDKKQAGDYSFVTSENFEQFKADMKDRGEKSEAAELANYARYRDRINAGDFSFLKNLHGENKDRTFTQDETIKLIDFTARLAAGDYSFVLKQTPENQVKWYREASFEDRKSFDHFKQQALSGNFAAAETYIKTKQPPTPPEKLQEERDKWIAQFPAISKVDGHILTPPAADATPEAIKAYNDEKFDVASAYAKYTKDVESYKGLHGKTDAEKQDWLKQHPEYKDSAALWQKREQLGDHSFLNKLPKADKEVILEFYKKNPESKEAQAYQYYENRIAKGDYSHIYLLDKSSFEQWKLNSSPEERAKYKDFVNRINAGDLSFVDRFDEATRKDWVDNLTELSKSSPDARTKESATELLRERHRFIDRTTAGDWSMFDKLNDRNYAATIADATKEQWTAYQNYKDAVKNGDYSFVDRLRTKDGEATEALRAWIITSSKEEKENYVKYRNKVSPDQPLDLGLAEKSAQTSGGISSAQYVSNILEAKYRNPQLDAKAAIQNVDKSAHASSIVDVAKTTPPEKVDPTKAKQDFETLMKGLGQGTPPSELFKQVDAKAITAYLAAEPSVREPFLFKLKPLVAESRDQDAVNFVRQMTESGYGIQTMFKNGLGFASGGLNPSKTLKISTDGNSDKSITGLYKAEAMKRAVADTAAPAAGLVSAKAEEIRSSVSVLKHFDQAQWTGVTAPVTTDKKHTGSTGTVDRPTGATPVPVVAPPKNTDGVVFKPLGEQNLISAIKDLSASKTFTPDGAVVNKTPAPITIPEYDRRVRVDDAAAQAAAGNISVLKAAELTKSQQTQSAWRDALIPARTSEVGTAPSTNVVTVPGRVDASVAKDLSYANRPTATDSTWSSSAYKTPAEYVKTLTPAVRPDENTRQDPVVRQDRASAEAVNKQQVAEMIRIEDQAKTLVDQARKLVAIPDEVARKLDIALNNDPAVLKQLSQLLRTTSDKGVDIVSLSALLAANDKTGVDSRQRGTDPVTSGGKSGLVDPSSNQKIVSLSELTGKGTGIGADGRPIDSSSARVAGDFIGVGKGHDGRGVAEVVSAKAGSELIAISKGPVFDPTAVKGGESVRLASGDLVVTKGNIEIAGTGIKVAPNDILSALVGQNVKFDIRTDGRISGVEIANSKGNILPGTGNELSIGKGEHIGIRVLGPGELGLKGGEAIVRDGKIFGDKFVTAESGTVKNSQGFGTTIFIPGSAGSIKADGSTKGDRLPDTLQVGKDPALGIGLGSGTIGQGGNKGQPGQNQDPTLTGLNFSTNGGVVLQPVNLPTVQITGQDPKATGTTGTDPDAKKKDPAEPQQTGAVPDPANTKEPAQQDPQAKPDEQGKKDQIQTSGEAPAVKPTETTQVTVQEPTKTSPEPFINMEPHGPIVPVINHWEPRPVDEERIQKHLEPEPVLKPAEVEPAVKPETPRQISPAEQLLINEQLIQLLSQTQEQANRQGKDPEHREVIDKKEDSQSGQMAPFAATKNEDPMDPAAILRNAFEQYVAPVLEQTDFTPTNNPIESTIDETISQVLGGTEVQAPISLDPLRDEADLLVNTLLNGAQFTDPQSIETRDPKNSGLSNDNWQETIFSPAEAMSDMIDPKAAELISEVQAAFIDLDNNKDSSVEEKIKSLLQKNELDEKNRREMEEEELKKLEESKLAALALLEKLRERQAREAKEAEARREAAKKQSEKPVEKVEARRKYIVLRGDTLESIAARTLRNKRLAGLLYDINKSRIPVKKVDGKNLLQLTPRLVLMLPTQAEVIIYLSSAAKPRVFEYDQNLKPNDLQSLLNTKKNGNTRAEAEDLSSAPTVSPEEALADNPRINYSCRLGETLKSIAMNHPALKDCTLWKLIASINNLSTDVDINGNPVTKLTRGQVILLPSAQDVADYKAGKNKNGAH